MPSPVSGAPDAGPCRPAPAELTSRYRLSGPSPPVLGADQVKNELLFASLEQLAEEHDLAPLSPPNVDPFKIELPKAGPFTYEFDVEVRPEFDLPNYKGLKLKRPVRMFTDEDVAREENR